MQIGVNSLLQEMQSLSGQISPSHSRSLSDLGNELGGTQITRQINNTLGSDFGELLTQALGAVGELQSNSGSLATRLDMGDTRVTLSDAVIAREKASVVFEATVQVRNKLLEAYKEIMSMPV